MNRLQKKLEKIGSDPKVTAKAVGLRYSLKSDKGYYRKRKGSGFSYIDETGNAVKDKEVLERIKKLGNTRTVCKKYYVHPSVIAAYENGHISKYKCDVVPIKGELTAQEKALLELLSNEDIAEVVA